MSCEKENSKERLEDIQKEIENKYGIDKVWFFPEDPKKILKKENDSHRTIVKGFLGTQDIIFFGLNPSTGNWDKKNKLFYSLLEQNGFENAHVTDLIKIRASKKERDGLFGNDMLKKEMIGYLEREIRIIGNIKLIVTMGITWKDTIFNEFINDLKISNIQRKDIIHYAATRIPHNKKRLKDDMKKVKEAYMKLKKE